jgi:hypothetical protein
MSSTQVFVSYLTLPSVWVPNSVKSYVKSLFYPWRFISNTDIPLLISLENFVPLEYMNKRIRLTTLNGNTDETEENQNTGYCTMSEN